MLPCKYSFKISLLLPGVTEGLPSAGGALQWEVGALGETPPTQPQTFTYYWLVRLFLCAVPLPRAGMEQVESVQGAVRI